MRKKKVIYPFLWAGKTEMVYLFYSQRYQGNSKTYLLWMYVCVCICSTIVTPALIQDFRDPAVVLWSSVVVSFGKRINLSDSGSAHIPAAGNFEELSWNDQRKYVAFYSRQTWSFQACKFEINLNGICGCFNVLNEVLYSVFIALSSFLKVIVLFKLKKQVNIFFSQSNLHQV